MDRVVPLKAVYLFGSHARGEARPDSDVDLCLVAEGAEPLIGQEIEVVVTRSLQTAMGRMIFARPITSSS